MCLSTRAPALSDGIHNFTNALIIESVLFQVECLRSLFPAVQNGAVVGYVTGWSNNMSNDDHCGPP